MDGNRAALIVRELFDVVRVVPPVFETVDVHQIGGIWHVGCIVDGVEYSVKVGSIIGGILSVKRV